GGDFGAEIFGGVFGIAKEDGLGVEQRDLRGEGGGVGVANLEGSGRGGEIHDFVTGGKNGDSGPSIDRDLRCADLGGGSELCKAKRGSFCEDGFVGGLFAAARDDVLARGDCSIQGNCVTPAL